MEINLFWAKIDSGGKRYLSRFRRKMATANKLFLLFNNGKNLPRSPKIRNLERPESYKYNINFKRPMRRILVFKIYKNIWLGQY